MKIEPITSRIGARITDIDASQPLDGATIAGIKQALNRHCVVFFPGQPIMSGEAQLDFARQFGAIETPPKLTKESVLRDVLILEYTQPKGGGTDIWHTDGSYLEKPPFGSILQAHVLPETGGDTCFASMYAAYDALSEPMRAMLDGMTARHSTERVLQTTRERGNVSYDNEQDSTVGRSHPIVTVDPLTGRRRLYVNPNYTVAIDGVSKAESDCLLGLLYEHVKSPEFQMRYTWSLGDIAFWDNLAVQHYALADYNSRRRMQRVTLLGERPVGVERLRVHEAA